MRDLPRGTVTFLFTDVEGSTRLLQNLGAQSYAAELATHRHVLREAFGRHGGIEVDTQGDAFFIAFATAPGALSAAIEAQASLSIPVRMGVHTGTPLLTEEGYVGADVHEAARIAAAGHGRQILVSATTAPLVDAAMLRDLGMHRLKDLTEPVRIYQVGDHDFPPLKTLYRTNLPVSATSFVGRSAELAAVGELLGRADVRLLTLTGPGGCGKTRLALQSAAAAAQEYPHGVWWVPLASVRDADGVVAAVAGVLGGDAPLAELIADRRLLLLLDNFEHVIPAAGDISTLLTTCPNVGVLVTSRERLRITGEQVYAVPELTPSDARSLFVARARAARSDFEPDELTDELCKRLDELPLALELAAARTSLLSSRQLLDRLGGRLDLLRGGRDADARQQTLRATIEWSYDLLEPDEQRALAAMSVFRAPWTVDAAENVAGADVEVLESLVDKSLLRRLPSGRLSMLEMIREFAAERLSADARDEAMQRLVAHLTDVFAPLDPRNEYSRGPAEMVLAQAERPNVDAALAWALEAGAVIAGLVLVTRLEYYWPTSDALTARRYVDQFLTAAGDDIAVHLRARALRLRGATFDLSGRGDLATADFEEAARLFRSIEDAAAADHLVHRLANGALQRNDIDRAVELATEALAVDRRLGRGHDEAAALGVLARAAFARGDSDEGLRLSYESAAVADRVGFTWWKGITLVTIAEHLLAAGEADDAIAPATDGLQAVAAVDDRVNLPGTLVVFAALAATKKQAHIAGQLWGAVEAIADSEPRRTTQEAMAEYEPLVRGVHGPDFDEGRREGRTLSSAAAVARAVEFGTNYRDD